MTNTTARERIYDLLRQTSTDSQWDTDIIDAAVNQGRRLYAGLLPDEMLPGLQSTATSISVVNGIASFPSDYLRLMKNPLVKIDSVVAELISDDEVWRMKFIESNDNTKSGTSVKRYRLRGNGLEVYPTNATEVTQLEYIKIPDDLDANPNSDLTTFVEDLTIDWAFERLMSTEQGDMEIALKLLKERINVNL